jgi:hypothetical protein
MWLSGEAQLAQVKRRFACGDHRVDTTIRSSVKNHEHALVQIRRDTVELGVLAKEVNKVVAIPWLLVHTGSRHRRRVEQVPGVG